MSPYWIAILHPNFNVHVIFIAIDGVITFSCSPKAIVKKCK
jgi:hypothetical protein